MDGTDDMLWMLKVSVRKMKALTVIMETVIMIGKGKLVYDMPCVVKYLFSRHFIFGGVVFRFGKIHFPLADMFFWRSA
jgi:hypothetical protein